MSGDPKRTIAARAALELQAGEVVNLGIGIPNMIPMFLDDDAGVYCTPRTACSGWDRGPTRTSSTAT